MNKKICLLSLCAIAALTLIPLEILAQTNDFGAANLVEHSRKLQDFLFGPVMRTVGIFGAIGSFIHGMMKSTFTPIFTYGAICLCIVIIPLFLDGIFDVSGMLLP